MSLAICYPNVGLCTGDSVLIYNLESKNESIIALPKLECEKEIKAHNREDIESFHTLTSVLFSDDGQYFLVCTNRKQLCLYKTEGFQLISNKTMARAVSKVRFLPNNDIIVADKSGDAYLFSTSKSQEKEELLLGHLSMLLDIIGTDDQKYIITADRDEKIRVSMFPNSYNIVSYCLGHTNFVTNVAFLPQDKNILVSSGGDGKLMFWDYLGGKELLTVYFHEKLSQNDLVQLNQTLKENDLEDHVTVSPVKHLKLLRLNEIKSVIVISFYCSNIILVYTASKDENGIKVDYVQSIEAEKEPLECQLCKQQLWILSDSYIEIYKLDKGHFVIDKNYHKEIEKLNETWKKLHNASIKTLLPVLYKRKFDTVQEYQERKKSRLIDKSKM